MIPLIYTANKRGSRPAPPGSPKQLDDWAIQAHFSTRKQDHSIPIFYLSPLKQFFLEPFPVSLRLWWNLFPTCGINLHKCSVKIHVTVRFMLVHWGEMTPTPGATNYSHLRKAIKKHNAAGETQQVESTQLWNSCKITGRDHMAEVFQFKLSRD